MNFIYTSIIGEFKYNLILFKFYEYYYYWNVNVIRLLKIDTIKYTEHNELSRISIYEFSLESNFKIIYSNEI